MKKKRVVKKTGLAKKLSIVGVLFILLFISFFLISKPDKSPINNNVVKIVFSNPMSEIASKNSRNGQYDSNAVINQGIKQFNESYINYLLIAIGTGSLHWSPLGGNPKVEFAIDSETWNTEVVSGKLKTVKGAAAKKDIRIALSKEEAVKALLSSDITSFMKSSVVNGRTKIEMVAGRAELFSKGYLDMYNRLSR